MRRTLLRRQGQKKTRIMINRLPKTFFTVPTVRLAKELLGCVLVRETDAGQMAGIIIETEAYTEDDAASHSFNGRRTKRNEMMFACGGRAYVYVSYGMHHCLNVVSEGMGQGCAVLIRAVVPTEGISVMRKNRGDKADAVLTNGPGKLCQAFGISLADNGIDMTSAQSPLYVLPREKESLSIRVTPRIGITKAKNKKRRFLCSG